MSKILGILEIILIENIIQMKIKIIHMMISHWDGELERKSSMERSALTLRRGVQEQTLTSQGCHSVRTAQ